MPVLNSFLGKDTGSRNGLSSVPDSSEFQSTKHRAPFREGWSGVECVFRAGVAVALLNSAAVIAAQDWAMSALSRAEGRGASSRGAVAVSGCWGRERHSFQCVASGELPMRH